MTTLLDGLTENQIVHVLEILEDWYGDESTCIHKHIRELIDEPNGKLQVEMLVTRFNAVATILNNVNGEEFEIITKDDLKEILN